MNNLNEFGKRHLWTYISDYQNGNISEYEARLKIKCCFNDRGSK